MIRAHKVRAVATFELLCTMKSKSYLIATFGMPLFLLLYGAIVAIPGYLEARERSETKIYGVVDLAGVTGLVGDRAAAEAELPDEIRSALEATGRADALEGVTRRGSLLFRAFPDEASARAALLDKRIRGFFLLRPDFLETGSVESFLPEGLHLEAKETRRPLERLVLDGLLAGRLPPEVAARAREPVTVWRERTVEPDGRVTERSPFAVFAQLLVPLAFAVLLLVSLMMSAGFLIQATATEKENRVVEVLLSTAGSTEILAGKLLGLGAAGLIQIAVWFSMVIVALLFLAASMTAAGIGVSWWLFPVALCFFVAAYLFVGSLMLGTGSLGSTMRESQQLSMIWSLPTVIPLLFLTVLLREPHGAIARVLTWIPQTAPVTVVFRIALDPAGIAWWEIAGSLLVMAAATWVALRLGARLFRVGLLLTGARPKLREILRQARLSG